MKGRGTRRRSFDAGAHVQPLSGQPLVQETGAAGIVAKGRLPAPGFDGRWANSRKQPGEKLEVNFFVLESKLDIWWVRKR